MHRDQQQPPVLLLPCDSLCAPLRQAVETWTTDTDEVDRVQSGTLARHLARLPPSNWLIGTLGSRHRTDNHSCRRRNLKILLTVRLCFKLRSRKAGRFEYISNDSFEHIVFG